MIYELHFATGVNKQNDSLLLYVLHSFFPLKYIPRTHILWGVGMWLASQVIFFGVAALLCSLIRFPFPSGVISLSVAPANLTAMVHLEEKNGGTPCNNSTSTTPPSTPLHNNAFLLGKGNNVSSWSIWTISTIWIMLFWRDWEGGGFSDR